MKVALVIDDDSFWRRVFSDVLVKSGYKVYNAQDGLEGISKAMKYKPDVVVVDYILPKVNGSYIVRFLRSNPSFKNAGIVLTVINTDIVNEYIAHEYGANLLIEKEKGVEEAVERFKNFLIIDFYTEKEGPIGISEANIETLMEIIDEDLRREMINRELLQLVKDVDDEKYVARRLWRMFNTIFKAKTFIALMLSTTSGRVYAFSDEIFGLDGNKVKEMLLSKLSKPVTPSEWNWFGNVKPHDDNGSCPEKFKVFKVVIHNEAEQGVLAFDFDDDVDLVRVHGFLKDLSLSIGILFRTLNIFRDYRTAADVDTLTGLATKKVIMSKLDEYVKLFNRQGVIFSIAMLDIDHFKKVNDTYGHVKGDEVLAKVGEIIRRNIRETDIAGRYGGEEFLVIFPGSDIDNAKRGVERILNSVRSFNWKKLGVEKVTISAGIARAVKGKTVTEIVEMADKALYEAKNSGRDTLRVYKGGEEK